MNIVSLSRACAFSALLCFAACKKSKEAEGPVNVGGYLSSGSWHVAHFERGGQDSTSAFALYTFTFASSGMLTASDSVTTASGNWGAGIADGVSKVNIVFPPGAPLSVFNADWNVQNASETGVELADTAFGGRRLLLERN